MGIILRNIALLWVLAVFFANPAAHAEERLELPSIMHMKSSYDVDIKSENKGGAEVVCWFGTQDIAAKVSDNGSHCTIMPEDGGTTLLRVMQDGVVLGEQVVHVYPGWVSVIPALLAIICAFLTRQVFFSLFLGIWSGAFLMAGGSIYALGDGLLRVIDTYLIRAIVPEDGSIDHMAVVMFTLVVGGMIGIISANGGMHGVVRLLTKVAGTRKKGQCATYGMGFIIFFDDYANTLIVGKTLQPLIDRLRISREKLAFIVDATAAPLACIALATTWIGFQLSLIDDTLPTIGSLDASAYELFLGSLPYSFYPIMMLVFIVILILSGKDFGPMAKAEQRAIEQKFDDEGALEESGGNPWNAILPIATLIIVTIGGLFVTGEGDSIREILGNADPFKAMLWSSLCSLIVAIIMTILTRAMPMERIVVAMEDGFKPMLLAVMILTFAWAIADVNAGLNTADYVVSLLGDSLNPALLPTLVFIVAAMTAFTTGTSWGVMAILIPLVLPLAWTATTGAAMPEEQSMMIVYGTLASVMAGAVWGDHCSPISDTTILSSIASGCPHIEHVRTQMPYAISVAIVAIVAGTLPAGFGVPPIVSLLVGTVLLILVVKRFGTKILQN